MIRIIILVLSLSGCAFLPVGPVEAELSGEAIFHGVKFEHKLILRSKVNSGSHSFVVFAFSPPHEETATIYLNSINGTVPAKQLVVVNGISSTSEVRLTEGAILFSQNQVLVDLKYVVGNETSNYRYNGKYFIKEK